MRNWISSNLHLLSCLLITILLVHCGPAPSDDHPASTITPSRVPSPFPTLTVIPTEPPKSKLQLTFVSDDHSLYAIDIGCPERIPPCLGEPYLLFELPSKIFPYSWSPDGQRVALDTIGEGGKKGDIFIADWDGKNMVNITRSQSDEIFPAWSPDGSRIAYTAISYEGHSIVSVNPNGEDPEDLLSLANVLDPFNAVWSPDGEKLAFVAYEPPPLEGIMQVYIANLDGSGLIQLTDANSFSCSPAFSPDGEKIVLWQDAEDEANGGGDILITSYRGTDEISLIDTPYYYYGPAWSPLGDWIAFFSEESDGSSDIYLIKPDGTHLINVTLSPNDESNPAWRLFVEP